MIKSIEGNFDDPEVNELLTKHFIELRSANGTQKESIEIAQACAAVIGDIFPLIKEYCHE